MPQPQWFSTNSNTSTPFSRRLTQDQLSLMSLKMAVSAQMDSKFKIKVILWLMVSWPVCLGVRHASGAHDQIFITVRQWWVCWCGVDSLVRGQVCSLQLLLGLASTIILGSESRRTHDHNLLSQISDSHNLEGQVTLFISPRNKWPSYYPRHWVPF
jgi:hypothetical protein